MHKEVADNVAKSKYETHVQPKLKLVEAWARDGLTLDQIAHNLGIHRTTLMDYQKRYADFSDSLKRGKEEVDIEVENALFKRATGYEYEEVTRELMDVPDENGRVEKRLVVTKVVTKQMAPDPTSIIFWTKNRMPDKWRDRRENPTEEKDKGNLNQLVEALNNSAKILRGE